MSKYRAKLNLSKSIDEFNSRFVRDCDLLEKLCQTTFFLPNPANNSLFENFKWGSIKEKINLAEVLQRSIVNPVDALTSYLLHVGVGFSSIVIKTTAISIKYSGYIAREEQDNLALNKLEAKKISWEKLLENKNLSFECKQRISKIQPETFGQLKRIEGIRPATLTFVASGL